MGPIGLHDGARLELRAAVGHHREVDPKLAEDFAEAYIERVRYIARFPEGGTLIPEHRVCEVRRFALRRFPYKLIVAVVDERAIIVAVAHDARRPGYWRERLPR
jgi:toxin ParE1/3/4